MTIEDLRRTISAVNTGIDKLVDHALAYIAINERVVDATNYCQKYSMPNAWGRNIWHVILDDAVRMRNELEQAKDAKVTKK